MKNAINTFFLIICFVAFITGTMITATNELTTLIYISIMAFSVASLLLAIVFLNRLLWRN